MEKHSYLYFMLFFPAALLLSAGTLKAAFFLSRKLGRPFRRFSDCREPYNGGFPSLQNDKKRFPVRFATVALLFVLFNAEILLLLPWAASLRLSGVQGFCCALIFLGFWAAAYAYEYKKGALDRE